MSDKPVTTPECARCGLEVDIPSGFFRYIDGKPAHHNCEPAQDVELARLRAARLADAGVIEGLRGELERVGKLNRYHMSIISAVEARAIKAEARVAELESELVKWQLFAEQRVLDVKRMNRANEAAERRAAEAESNYANQLTANTMQKMAIDTITRQRDLAESARDEWKQQHENLLAVRDQDIRALTARAAEDHKDAERLDWFEQNVSASRDIGWMPGVTQNTLREAIDAAIASRQSGEKESDDGR